MASNSDPQIRTLGQRSVDIPTYLHEDEGKLRMRRWQESTLDAAETVHPLPVVFRPTLAPGAFVAQMRVTVRLTVSSRDGVQRCMALYILGSSGVEISTVDLGWEMFRYYISLCSVLSRDLISQRTTSGYISKYESREDSGISEQ
jgi:hypothetical protein